MSDFFWFSDAQWARIEPLLPTDVRGKPRVDDRRVLSGIVHALRCGGRWADCADVYGPKKTLYNRFVRWAERDIWEGIFGALAGAGDAPDGGMPGMGAYGASKSGLIGLVQSLASDHAVEGIRVNALLPGGTITPSGGEGNPAALEFIAGLHPMKRMATAKEIAQAALFLLSDRSSFMTGSPMIVDGGMSVRLT